MTTTPSKLQQFAENFSSVITEEIWAQALRAQDEKERSCMQAVKEMVNQTPSD